MGGQAVVRVLVVGALVGCGGEGVVAPRTENPDRCPPADAWLEDVYALMDQGRLDHVRRVVEDDLTDDDRRNLVAAVLSLADDVPPGSLARLGEAAETLDATGPLQDAAARALRVVARSGPGAPYPEALAAARRALNTCDGASAVALVGAVLEEDALLRALLAVPAEADLAAVLEGMEVDGATGRPAARALARNLLVAAASDDFTADAWIAAARLVVDADAQPWRDLLDGLERLLAPGPVRADLAVLARCLLDVDPDMDLVVPAFDALTDPDLAIGAALETLDPEALLQPALMDPVRALTAALRDDAAARRALGVLGTAALARDAAPGVMEDIAGLLEAHLAGDVVRLVGALATRSCDR